MAIAISFNSIRFGYCHFYVINMTRLRHHYLLAFQLIRMLSLFCHYTDTITYWSIDFSCCQFPVIIMTRLRHLFEKRLQATVRTGWRRWPEWTTPTRWRCATPGKAEGSCRPNRSSIPAKRRGRGSTPSLVNWPPASTPTGPNALHSTNNFPLKKKCKVKSIHFPFVSLSPSLSTSFVEGVDAFTFRLHVSNECSV